MIVLGIDCGTQSTKTVALEWASGAILASAQKAYDLLPNLPPGSMEQNPEDWDAAMQSTLAEVISKLGERKNEIRAIGVSGQQHGLVVLDENDKVVRPAKLWCDTSTISQCEAITRALGGTEKVISMAGNAILPGYTAPKIRWLYENEPGNWEKTTSVLLPHDYLNFRLTGVKCMEFGDASGTALLDVRARRWSDSLCKATAPDVFSKLPPLKPSSESHGLLSEGIRQSLSLPEGIVVSAGGGDNMMGAIGTGNVSPGVVTASLGTSGTLYAYSPTPVIDPKGEVAAFCDSTDAWLPLVCTMNVTLVTELARKLFGWSHADYDQHASQIPPGSEGLLLLPYLVGERTPNLPSGTGILHGLRTTNMTPGHLARAMMEGVTLGLGYGLDRFRDLGISPTEIRLTGGGSNSPLWRQICADVFDVPVVCLKSGEGAALGAAIQAGWMADHSQTLPEICARLAAVDEDTRAVPSDSSHAIYNELQERACRLRVTLSQGGLL